MFHVKHWQRSSCGSWCGVFHVKTLKAWRFLRAPSGLVFHVNTWELFSDEPRDPDDMFHVKLFLHRLPALGAGVSRETCR